jgi:hypothetical protein
MSRSIHRALLSDITLDRVEFDGYESNSEFFGNFRDLVSGRSISINEENYLGLEVLARLLDNDE